MKIVRRRRGETVSLERNAACIGFFDGVHRGHQKLIKDTVAIARKKGIASCLISFDKDPGELYNPEKHIPINTLEERIALYGSFGIDIVVLLIFDEEMMKTGKEEFIRDYLAPLNIDTLVCGFDFTFGYRGEGNAKTLQESPYRNYELIVEEEVTYYGKKISSTRIREELRKGNLRLVNKLLGYEYGKRTV